MSFGCHLVSRIDSGVRSQSKLENRVASAVRRVRILEVPAVTWCSCPYLPLLRRQLTKIPHGGTIHAPKGKMTSMRSERALPFLRWSKNRGRQSFLFTMAMSQRQRKPSPLFLGLSHVSQRDCYYHAHNRNMPTSHGCR